MPTDTAKHEFANFADDDVNFLYKVILEAQKLPQPPLRALFLAYDNAKAKDGAITQEKNKLYFTFLLRMGEKKSADESLYGRFASLLKSSGINVAPEELDDYIEEITRAFDLPALNGVNAKDDETTEQPRRASFGTITDHLAEDETRDDSLRATAAAHRELEARRPSSRASQRPGLGDGFAPLRSLPSDAALGRGRQQNLAPNHLRRASSISSHGSLKITRGYGSEAYSQDGDYSADESGDMSFDEPRVSTLDSHDHLFEGYRPYNEVLEDAEDFRAGVLRRQTFASFRQHIGDVHRQHDALYRQATEHDRKALLRSGFEMWREQYRLKRQELETNHFFVHMERRADRAREVYLITKAFTHWRHNAAEEINRTSVAKRHILRMRYFSAWKDITAVNMLKVRKHTLAKFMGKWKQKKAALDGQDYNAVIHHEDHLVARIYWRWFWSYCERRSPGLHLNHLRLDLFTHWFNLSAQLRAREGHVEAMWAHKQQRKALESWAGKYQELRRLRLAASDFDRQHVLRTHFDMLGRESRFRPAQYRIGGRVDNRVLRTAFQSWKTKMSQSREAEVQSRKRQMKSMLEKWKCQVIASRIDERLVVNSLYQWMLAARVPLLRRTHDAKLLQSVFGLWKMKARDRRMNLETAYAIVKNRTRVRVTRSFLAIWRSKKAAHAHHEHMVLQIYEPRVKANAWGTWLFRHRQIQEHERWSSDAFLYVSAKHSLALWRAAAEQSRRNRKRDAYAQIRKRVKVDLARRTLLQWRDAAAQSVHSQRRAVEMQENRLFKTLTSALQTWQHRTYDLQRLSQQADDHHRRTLLQRSWKTWSARHTTILTLQEHGQSLSRELAATTASNNLKSLDRRLFHIRLQQQNAQQLHQRNFEKHQRNMLRHWLFLATRAHEADVNYVTAPDLRRTMGISTSAPPIAAPYQPQDPPNEPITAFDPSAVDLNFDLQDDPDAQGSILTSTPFQPRIQPAYMRTPRLRHRLTARSSAASGLAQTFNLDVNSTTPTGEPPARRRGGAMSAPPIQRRAQRLNDDDAPVTPFQRKLSRQGMGRGRFGGTPRRVGFAGFESVREASEEGLVLREDEEEGDVREV